MKAKEQKFGVLVIGGLPQSLVNFRGKMLQKFRANGHRVVACAGGEDKKTSGFLRNIGGRYYSLPIQRTGMNPFQDFQMFTSLLRLFRRTKPDKVMAYTVKPVVYGLLAARVVGIKDRYAMISGLGYAFMGGDSFKQRFARWIVPRMYRIALTGCKCVFFQNRDDLKIFTSYKILSPDTRVVRIMGSGVDLESFTEEPLPKGNIVFLLIGRLIKDKGLREYYMASRILKQKYPEAKCAILGPTDSNPSRIKEGELAEWIQSGIIDYWGEVDDVRPSILKSTVFVLPSYREGMPRSVLEAKAMGRPIITTDVPGCRDTVVEGENGFLVPKGDHKALAEAMIYMVEHPDNLPDMGRESRRSAEEQFDVNVVNSEICEAMHL